MTRVRPMIGRVIVAVVTLVAVVAANHYLTSRRRDWPLREAARRPAVDAPLNVTAWRLPSVRRSGDGLLVAPLAPPLNRSSTGVVVWEAEWANRVTGTFAILPCRGAGANAALWAREGTGRNNKDWYVPPQYPHVDPGIADYYFQLPRSGRYRLFLRIWASDACGNSCWVGIDPSTDTDLHYFPGGTTGRFGAGHYHWPDLMFHRWLWINDEGHLYRLPAGLHRLRLEVREDGFAVDQVALVPVHARWPQTTLAATLIPHWPDDALKGILSTDTPSTRASGTLTPFDAYLAVNDHCLSADPSRDAPGWLWLRSNIDAPQTLTVSMACKHAVIAPSGLLQCRLSRDAPFAWTPVTVAFTSPLKRGCVDLSAVVTSAAFPRLKVTRTCRLLRPFDWQVAGPFPADLTEVVDKALAGATTVDLSRPPVPSLPEGAWRAARTPDHYDKFGALDFNLLFGHHEQAVAYAVTRIRVVRSGEYGLVAAADDQLRLWCDGRLLLADDRCRPLTDLISKKVVQLRKGNHLLVARVAQQARYWQLLVRIEDRRWKPTEEVYGLRMR